MLYILAHLSCLAFSYPTKITLCSFLYGMVVLNNNVLIWNQTVLYGYSVIILCFFSQEARNIEDFLENFKDDPTVKIPRVYKELCGPRVLVMEWIDGIRCTDPQVLKLIKMSEYNSWRVFNNEFSMGQAIKDEGIDVTGFLTVGVSAALRQLLEFGLFHGDPHPGNIFAMRDGRIAYVDFGNVAVLSQVIIVQ